MLEEEVLDVLKMVGKKYKLRIGLDVAASAFYDKGYYMYKNKELIRDKVDQADYVERLIKKYGLFYVEDGMHEGDFSGFKEVLGSLGKKRSLVVGDDLTTTNLRLVRRAVSGKAINVDQSGALVLKLKNGSTTKIFSGDVSIRRQK